MNNLVASYQSLEDSQKTLLQGLAFASNHGTSALHDLIKILDVRQDNGRRLTQAMANAFYADWKSKGIVSKNEELSLEIIDLLIRAGLASKNADALSKFSEKHNYYYWRPQAANRKLIFAFQQQDEIKWEESMDTIVPGSIPLLHPFCANAYDRLSQAFKLHYFNYSIPGWITTGRADPAAIEALMRLCDSSTELPDALTPRLFDWAVAAGDLPLLKRIHTETDGKKLDVEACLLLLQGHFEQGFSLLANVWPCRSAKSLAKPGSFISLPTALGVIAGLVKLPPAQVKKAIESFLKSSNAPFEDAFGVVVRGLEFMSVPSETSELLRGLRQTAFSPLATWAAGCVQAWLAPDASEKEQVRGLVDAAKTLHQGGCGWLAAETYDAAGKTSLPSAQDYNKLARQLHLELQTVSLIDHVQPESTWSRTLAAIAALGNERRSTSATSTTSEAKERLIFEITIRKSDFDLEVFHQLRKGVQWSKGRKVGLSRLFHQYSQSEFAFITSEDRALCQTLRNQMEQNGYGYMEEVSWFDTRTGAKALVGHPRIFYPGKRETPLEIIEKPPALLVQELKRGEIKLSLQPKPPSSGGIRFESTGPAQIAITLFDPPHLKLQTMLGDGLRVPASASAKVLDTVTQLTSLITVHSEIQDPRHQEKPRSRRRGKHTPEDQVTVDDNLSNITPAKRIEGDARPHIHLLPSGDGIRAEIFVQPLGPNGPSCRPGTGGTTLYATIDGEAISASRDFQAEIQNSQAFINQCSSLPNHLTDAWTAVFPSSFEALELLVELEPFSSGDAVTVHWPKGRSLSIAGTASESMMRVRIRRDRNWFDVSGEVQIDKDRTFDLMQLLELTANSPSRFVQLGEGEFLALTDHLRQRIDDLRYYGDSRSSKGKLLFGAIHAGLLDDMGEAKVTADAHWKKCVKRMKEAAEVVTQVPETFQAELRPYQEEGIAWMQRLAAWGVGGCLADDMGLGKTIQAIAVLLERGSSGPAIVVAPTSVIHNWKAELTRFAPTLRPHILADGSRQELLDSLGPHDVLLCSYGLMQIEIEAIEKISFNTLILDEAQAIKNAATQRSKAAKRLTTECRFLLTGTPMENHLGELWNLMDFLNPGLLGSAESFQERFAIPIERDGDRAARQRLKRLVAPFILRRTKAQVLSELPARTETTLRIEPSSDEAAFYEAIRLRAIEKLAEATEGQPNHVQILSEITRLRRACCHPKLVVPESNIESSKLAQTLDTIDELRSGNHRALIFSQFVDHLQLLREKLDEREITYQYLDGSTPAKVRQERVDAFQAGKGEVFLISLKAGGTGLNLTAADYVIHLDPWWNPAVEDQASDRAHRIGQLRPVTIYRMVLAGTIEEKILALHATKRDLAESLLEGTDRSGKLTAEELMNLIKH